MLFWLFKPINGLPCEAIPIVIPFSNWQEAANWEYFVEPPRKI